MELRPRELVAATLRGQSVPRPVCGPLAVHFCAAEMGISLEDYTADADLLAGSILRYYERFRPDAVWVSADTWITAEAMGVPVSSPGPYQPPAGPPEGIIHTPADIDHLPPPDPTTQGRQPLLLEALRQVKCAVGDEAFVVACFDQSPFSLACAVGGMSSVMLKTMTDPPFVEALVERCTEYTIAYGLAMAACGADMLSTGDSPAGLIGPDLYRQLALPAEREVFSQLRRETDSFLSLHICGNATPILMDMAGSGADVLELDQSVALADALRVVPPEVAIWGNIDPVDVLLKGTPGEVRQACCRALSQARRAHHPFVLSSGCTLAPNTPAENVAALIGSVRESAA